MQQLDRIDLACVHGGQASPENFGRCGPGSSWQFLGNVYTPECAAHDATVRSGGGGVMAHIRALPQLPAAIGSYIGARLRGQG